MAKPPNQDKPQKPNKGSEGIPAPEGAVNLIDTDYVIGQDNITASPLGVNVDLHGKVFVFSSIVILLFVVLTLALQDQMEPIFNSMFSFLTTNLGWFFILGANVFVILAIVLIFTPLAKVRIGGADATPDFGYLGWFSMLFAAGMGIGLMFYGVAEPLGHYGTAMGGISVGEDGIRTDWAPLGAAAGDQAGAIDLSMAATIFHWGLHPWGAYAIVGLSLAIFSYNKGLPLTMRSIFYPILGERVWGWPGHVIDILAVFATLFGLTTSLGIGATQAAGGLEYLFGIPSGDTTLVLLILGITLVALGSIMLGVDKGVQRLSQINMVLAALLLGFVIIVGPTLMIVSVLLIPTFASVVWMTAFGTTAIDQVVNSGITEVQDAALELQLFTMLEYLPLSAITSFIGIVLVIVFFITSSDSGSLVIDSITAGGKVDAPKPQRIFWALIEGALAIALLLGGGLAALQTAALTTGLPFTLVLLVGCYAIVKGLMSEPR
ncbi:MAG: BCCT family transporter [Halomonas sp.]|nr:BCCT family transporter [Halomonas sp.]